MNGNFRINEHTLRPNSRKSIKIKTQLKKHNLLWKYEFTRLTFGIGSLSLITYIISLVIPLHAVLNEQSFFSIIISVGLSFLLLNITFFLGSRYGNNHYFAHLSKCLSEDILGGLYYPMTIAIIAVWLLSFS